MLTSNSKFQWLHVYLSSDIILSHGHRGIGRDIYHLIGICKSKSEGCVVKYNETDYHKKKIHYKIVGVERVSLTEQR